MLYYYPLAPMRHGLPWGNVEATYNETAMMSEFNSNEWGIDGGLDMNFFEARFYDPVLARWHSRDPLEQFHSPYLAMCDDPANFTDPDGRAGIPFLQDFMKSFLGECVIGSLQVLGTVAGVGVIMQIGGTMGKVVSGALSFGAIANTIKSVASIANQGSNVAQSGNALASQSAMGNSSVSASSFFGAGNLSSLNGVAEGINSLGGEIIEGLKSIFSKITFRWSERNFGGFVVHYGDNQTVRICSLSEESLNEALAASIHDPFVKEVVEAMKYLSPADAMFKKVLHKLARSPFVTNVYEGNEGSVYKLLSSKSKMYPENNRKHGLYFDPNEYLEGRDNDGNVIGKQSPALGFYHEATHRLRNLRRPMRVAIRSIFHSSNWSDLEEKRVVQKYESGIARILLEFIRTTDYR